MSHSMNKEFDSYTIRPEDVLADREYQVLQRALSGEIPCPWCEQSLRGSFYFYLEDGFHDKGVRLQCSSCGFDEW